MSWWMKRDSLASLTLAKLVCTVAIPWIAISNCMRMSRPGRSSGVKNCTNHPWKWICGLLVNPVQLVLFLTPWLTYFQVLCQSHGIFVDTWKTKTVQEMVDQDPIQQAGVLLHTPTMLEEYNWGDFAMADPAFTNYDWNGFGRIMEDPLDNPMLQTFLDHADTSLDDSFQFATGTQG